MITIWGKHAPHIKTFNHNGYGWAVEFHCGHSRFVPNEKSIALHEQKVLPVCDVINCSGWPKPGDIRERIALADADREAVGERYARLFEAAEKAKVEQFFKAAADDAATDRRRRQAEADLTSLANGDRLGPDATNNARIVQDRINRLKSPAFIPYDPLRGGLPSAAEIEARVERQKFEASVSESIMRLTRSLAVRRENEALADEKLKALKRDLLALTAFVDQVWKGQQ